MVSSTSAEAKAKPAKPVRAHGEDWLRDLETLTIRLESGAEVTFTLADETTIPTDVTVADLRRLDAASPGRLAFWGYQVARQRRAVRVAQRRLLEAEAAGDLVARKYVSECTDTQVTERAVRSHADLQPEVKAARLVFDEATYVLDVLDAVREAVRTRSFVLGRLLTTEARAAEG